MQCVERFGLVVAKGLDIERAAHVRRGQVLVMRIGHRRLIVSSRAQPRNPSLVWLSGRRASAIDALMAGATRPAMDA